MDLVIMAGGLGSRFGGLKQIEPIDKNGNFIIDYTIFDAIRSGFDRVIFIINKNNFEIFDNSIGKRIKPHIKVEYVFQENPYPNFRQKPLGTAHAVLCTKNVVSENFVVVNADDFYGFESLKLAFDALKICNERHFFMIAFEAANTLSEFGAVKRGICSIENDELKNVVECQIQKNGNNIFANELNNSSKIFQIKNETPVSMNLWCFNKSVLKTIEDKFDEFCKDENNLFNKEFFLPGVIKSGIEENIFSVGVKVTSSKWFGITYRDDKENFIQNLNKLVEEEKYPNNLWEN